MAVFKTFSIQRRPGGPDALIALWRCLKPFPYSAGPKGLMTAVQIPKFLRSKNLKLKNGMEAAILGVFAPRKLRKVKPRLANIYLEFHEVKLPTQIATRFASARDRAEIPEVRRRRTEELKRKPGFLRRRAEGLGAPQKMRPNS
jgi:hypothetical protein